MATEKKFSIKVQIDKAIEDVGNFKDKLANLPGPIGGVAQSLGGLTTAARAFIATPIGIIVAALSAVFLALKKGIESSEKATQGLSKIMGAFNGIIGPIIKSIGLLVEKLINGVVWAMEKVIDIASAMGISFADNAKAGMALADTLNQIEEAEGDLEVARAQQNKTLAEARELLSDTNATYAERKKALDEIRKSEEKLAAQEVELAKKQVAAAQENIRLYGASKEANDKLDAARIKLANTEESFAAKKRQFNREEKKLIAEVEAAAKEAAAKEEERRKEAAAKYKEYQQNRIESQKRTKAILDELALQEITDEEDRNKARIINETNLAITEARKTVKNKKDLEAEIAALTFKATQDIEKIEEEGFKKRNDLVTKYENLRKSGLSESQFNEKESINKYYDDLKIAQEKYYKDAYTSSFILSNGRELILAKEFQGGLVIEKEKTEKFKQIEEDRAKALLALNNKITKERVDKDLETSNKAYEIQKASYEKELYLLDRNAEDYDEKKKEIEAKRRDDEIANLEKRMEILKTGGEATANELLLAESEYYAKLNELREKDLEDEKANAAKKKEIRMQQIGGILTAANDLANAVGAIQDAQMQKELKDAGDNLAKQDQVKREYFEKNKKVQIAQAIIAAIQGAIGAFTSLSAIPVVGPVLGGIAAGAALATGFANVAKIRATSYESASGSGDGASSGPQPSKFGKGGLLTGRKHAEGGMSTPYGELEGGEFVINRQATASFLPLLEKINSMGSGSGSQNNESVASEFSNSTPQPIIKTYVVASEMTTQQEMDKKISDLARL